MAAVKTESQPTKKRRRRPDPRDLTEEQRVERRERNREHAKRSRIRKKFLLESLQDQVRCPLRVVRGAASTAPHEKLGVDDLLHPSVRYLPRRSHLILSPLLCRIHHSWRDCAR